MRRLFAFFTVFVLLLLAGCTDPAEESTLERGDYVSGRGVALWLRNNASDPFEVLVSVTNDAGVELGEWNVTVEPGRSMERYFPLALGTHHARMAYMWRAIEGSTRGGNDDQAFATGACPELTRLRWTFAEGNSTVGHRFDGRECVSADA